MKGIRCIVRVSDTSANSGWRILSNFNVLFLELEKFFLSSRTHLIIKIDFLISRS